MVAELTAGQKVSVLYDDKIWWHGVVERFTTHYIYVQWDNRDDDDPGTRFRKDKVAKDLIACEFKLLDKQSDAFYIPSKEEVDDNVNQTDMKIHDGSCPIKLFSIGIIILKRILFELCQPRWGRASLSFTNDCLIEIIQACKEGFCRDVTEPGFLQRCQTLSA